MRGVTHPLDAAVGLADHLGQGRASEVGELDGLEAGPQALDRVQLRRVGGQAFDHQPGPLAVQPGPHGTAAMGRQAVPQQGRLLTAEEAPQLRKDLDEAATEGIATKWLRNSAASYLLRYSSRNQDGLTASERVFFDQLNFLRSWDFCRTQTAG